MRCDVVIVGGGTSALFAALRLKAAGVSTVIVASGNPSAAMGCGELLAADGGPPPELPAEFRAALEKVFPEHRVRTDRYVTVNGRLVEAQAAPASAAGLAELPDRGVALISLPGVLDNPVEIGVAEILRTRVRDLRIIQIRLQSSIEDFYLSPVQWAARIDSPRYRADVLQRILFQLRGSEAAAFLFPPVLGIEKHEEFVGLLTRQVGVPIHELLGVPGWPPGIRTGLSVEKALADSGVEMLRERAVSVERKAGGDIEGVMTDGGKTLRGRFFILATGGMLGGGLRLDASLEEPVARLPLFLGGRRITQQASGDIMPSESFWAGSFLENDAIVSAGVLTDAEGRPLNEYGRPVSYNLRACGSIVGSREARARRPVDPGRSALSGWTLAEKLLKAL
jgi:anaerobic glycerol-3-phosphate dehydrogenase